MDVKKIGALTRQIELMEKNRFLTDEARARGIAILRKELDEVAGQLPLETVSPGVQPGKGGSAPAPKG